MATADGNTQLAEMMALNRQQEGQFNQELYNRRRDKHKDMMDMYKLELQMQSPLDRNLQTLSQITDPNMRYRAAVKLGLISPRPVLVPTEQGIAEYANWIAENPDYATPQDEARLNQAMSAAMTSGFEVEVKDGGDTVIQTAPPGVDINNYPIPGAGQPQEEEPYDMRVPVAEMPDTNDPNYDPNTIPDQSGIEHGEINDRSIMTTRAKADPRRVPLGGGKYMTRNNGQTSAYTRQAMGRVARRRGR